MTSLSELPLPPHFDRKKVREIWRVPYQDLAGEAELWARSQNISPSHTDEIRVCLLLVDCQNTFCIPGFELFVAGRSGQGAVEDNVRLCEFIYRNLHQITTVILTLDTHQAMQIFHPVFFVDQDGNHPHPLTTISSKDILNGKWKVNPAIAEHFIGWQYAELQNYALHYCHQLEKSGKYSLIVWPYHAMQGGIGHALVSAIEEAVFFHAIARQSRTLFEVKGSNPLTENYSVISPEVLEDKEGIPIDHKNTRLVQILLDHDMIIIAGQAKSHCVSWTVENLLEEINEIDSRHSGKIYLLEDCMSPVIIPGIVDYTDAASAAFARFSAAGVHIVQSTVPISSWQEAN